MRVVLSVPFSACSDTLKTFLCIYRERINRSAQAIHCTGDQNGSVETFFDRITKDIEIVRVALLLTGCIHGIRNTAQDYLNSIVSYDWLWRDKNTFYSEFMRNNPALDSFEKELKSFGDVDDQIDALDDVKNIGALSFYMRSSYRWKIKFFIHACAGEVEVGASH